MAKDESNANDSPNAGQPQTPPGELTKTVGPDTSVRIPKRIGHYHVKRVLASGGMGTVYEATQEKPRRVVAIKLMKQGIASRSALRRFEYESQILGRLRHPGIAQIYEAGTHRDPGAPGEPVPFFAMEYIPNARSITEYAREKKLGTRERLELFAHVCDAVHHGHQKGIIHRDLKPGNILVDSHGNVKVIDFGVARGTDSDMAVTTLQTDIGQLIGTLQYMSPEQCEADPHDIDTRSDVYALGVVLYELLADRLPYDVSHKPLFETTRVIREQQPTRLSTADATLKGDIETIAFKALEKNRDCRYQSVIELAQDVRRYLAGEAIIARPPSITYQLRIFARRHRALFVGTAAVFAVLVAGVVVSTSLLVREKAARREAIEAQKESEQARRGEAEQRRLAEDRFFSLPKNISEVTPQEARLLLGKDEGYVYLDVRTVTEFTQGHVPGALNVPLATRNPTTRQMEMNERYLAVVQASIPIDARVIVGCRSGRRSARATRIMLEAGYKHVFSMLGGFIAKKDGTGRVVVAGWSELGYPIERGDGDAKSFALLSAKAKTARSP